MWIRNVIKCLILELEIFSHLSTFTKRLSYRKKKFRINHFKNLLHWITIESLLSDYLCFKLCLHAKSLEFPIGRPKNNLNIANFRFCYEHWISQISLQVESRRFQGWIRCFGIPEEYKSIKTTSLSLNITHAHITNTKNSRNNFGHCLSMNVFKTHRTVCNQH